MVNEKASKWVIAIIIYFILLSSIFVVVNSFKDEFDLEDTDLLSSSGGSDNFEGVTSICESPRFDDDTYDRRYANDPSYKRMFNLGYITTETECLAFEGATWTEAGFWSSLFSSDFYCDGVIPTDSYNYNVVYANVASFGYWDEPVCGLGELQTDQGLCESFGCTYYSDVESTESLEDYIENANSVSGFLSFVNGVKSVTTLRVQFYTDSDILNGLLTFMLIWVPFLGLMLSFYELVRG